MKLIFNIARRYLFSKKSSNAINIITWVSIIGIGVGTAALILVLSVFNGLTDFIEDLFAAIDPDIKVVATQGQTFTYSDSTYQLLLNYPGVASVTRTLEGRVWMDYVDNQTIATLKGVEPDFVNVNPLDTFVYEGNYTFGQKNGVTQAILGSIVASRLSASLSDETRPINISYIPQGASFSNPENAVNIDIVFPAGFFSVQKEYDEQLVITDLSYVKRLFQAEDQLSAYEIRLSNIDRAGRIQKELTEVLGPQFQVLTWYEQHSTLYRVMKNEKYISYLILGLMLALTAVNIVGCLSMIVLEKTRDIAILKSMGATRKMVWNIFQATGLLVGGLGGLIGVAIALVAGLAQKQFGLVQLEGGENFRVKAFPIELELLDFLLVFATVMLLATLASLYPANQAGKIAIVKGLRQ